MIKFYAAMTEVTSEKQRLSEKPEKALQEGPPFLYSFASNSATILRISSFEDSACRRCTAACVFM